MRARVCVCGAPLFVYTHRHFVCYVLRRKGQASLCLALYLALCGTKHTIETMDDWMMDNDGHVRSALDQRLCNGFGFSFVSFFYSVRLFCFTAAKTVRWIMRKEKSFGPFRLHCARKFIQNMKHEYVYYFIIMLERARVCDASQTTITIDCWHSRVPRLDNVFDMNALH